MWSKMFERKIHFFLVGPITLFGAIEEFYDPKLDVMCGALRHVLARETDDSPGSHDVSVGQDSCHVLQTSGRERKNARDETEEGA